MIGDNGFIDPSDLFIRIVKKSVDTHILFLYSHIISLSTDARCW